MFPEVLSKKLILVDLDSTLGIGVVKFYFNRSYRWRCGEIVHLVFKSSDCKSNEILMFVKR